MKKIIASSMVIFMLFASILSVSAETLSKTIKVTATYGTGQEKVTADISLSNVNSPKFTYSGVTGTGGVANSTYYRFNGFKNTFSKDIRGDKAVYAVRGEAQWIDANYAFVSKTGTVTFTYKGGLS